MMSNPSTKSIDDHLHTIIIQHQFMLTKQVYQGNVQNIYLAIKKNDPGKYYMIKMRKVTANENSHEMQFVNKLKDLNCIPTLIACGQEQIKNQFYDYQVCERHGPSIKLIHQYYSRQLPIQILCQLAIQTLTCLERIHQQSIIHRNIRPKKLLTSQNGKEVLLTDFKNAYKFKKNSSFLQMAETNKLSTKQFINKYSSINTHMGQVPSPKDDLESLAYILFSYAGQKKFLTIKEGTKYSKLKQIEQIKLGLIPEKELKKVPREFIEFYQGVRMSNLQDYPCEYDKYKQLFRRYLQSIGYSENQRFPWVKNESSVQFLGTHSIPEEPYEDDDETSVSDLHNDNDTDVEVKLKQLKPLPSKLLIQLSNPTKLKQSKTNNSINNNISIRKIQQNTLQVPFF